VRKLPAKLVVIAMLAATTSVRAEQASLKTLTGNNIGLSVSSYQYREPGVMSLKGAKMGLDMHVVKVSEERDNLIFRGDLRFAFGTVDYNSNNTGSATGEPDWYLEARALLGKDWEINHAVLSPYIGLGYRYLFNDGRGISSTGYGGYRRESNYIYLPLGIIHRRSFNGRARLESTLEYDRLLEGTQVSSLSDVGGGYSDVTNNQSNGYGLKLSIMYENNNWVIGPYVHYWNISQSDIVPEVRYGVPTGYGLVEPDNNTIEFGLKVGQRF
jgi:hypothetical protein